MNIIKELIGKLNIRLLIIRLLNIIMDNKFKTLISALKALECKVFYHASANQSETVETFLDVIVRKAKLENYITLAANWTKDTIEKKYVNIIISCQNEIANIKHVETLYDMIIKYRFVCCKFMKFIEYENDVETLSITIDTTNIKATDFRFNVASTAPDTYGRTIQMIVYVDEIIDKLLKSTAEEDHWIPDKNLFYMFDLIFGEYYMTKHITTINFVPTIIMRNISSLTPTETKEAIDTLIEHQYKTCKTCGIKEYRINIGEVCYNCQ